MSEQRSAEKVTLFAEDATVTRREDGIVITFILRDGGTFEHYIPNNELPWWVARFKDLTGD